MNTAAAAPDGDAGLPMSLLLPARISLALLLLLVAYRIVIVPHLPEITHCFRLIRILFSSKLHSFRMKGLRAFSFADVWEKTVDANPFRILFISAEDDKEVSLRDVDVLANQVSHWADEALQLRQGDTVALMMLNKPEFVSIWLGMAKIGVTTALINTNVTGKALMHCVMAGTTNAASDSCDGSESKRDDASRRVLLVDVELRGHIASDLADLQAASVHVIFYDETLAQTLRETNESRVDRAKRGSVRERDSLLLIYTSGTTGLPKAGKISHSRFRVASLLCGVMCDLTAPDDWQRGDRLYCSLPLYHSSAGMLGVSACMRYGCPMVLKKRFSARNFATDCVKHGCTVVLYIGELARYLLAAPENAALERQLRIRCAFGNGIRPDVWRPFQKRFRIKQIAEFYAATEGNVVLINTCNKIGALGYVPRFADFLYPVKLLRPDPENPDSPFRNPATGRCEVCGLGEAGLVVGAIDNSRVDRRFDGYTDSAASNKKVLLNVFEKGDAYFNTGDMLLRDAAGFFYWSDRTGDTFRWKGENVSTAEVAEVVSKSDERIRDVCVYGVEVPGCDGKAGMAAITVKDFPAALGDEALRQINSAIALAVKKNLPAFARPLFVRYKHDIEMTSTFKHKKTELVFMQPRFLSAIFHCSSHPLHHLIHLT